MALNLLEVSTAGFRTTREADQQCERLKNALGYKVNYLVARLAIARSLALTDHPPPEMKDEEDDGGRTIRGHQLFGEGPDAAAWVSLLVQRAGNPNLSRRDLQALVLAHWKRGAQLLVDDWDAMGHSLPRFVDRLAGAAGLPAAGSSNGSSATSGRPEAAAYANPVAVPIGEVGEDADTGEPVFFPLNAPGGSPHMAIMGGVGSGKTRTAARMLRAIRDVVPVPLLAFDFKGDLASAYSLDAV